jgi:uncharacterized protein YuzE
LGDLFVRFRHVEQVEGEITEDERVIVHYDVKGRIAAIEITNITTL